LTLRQLKTALTNAEIANSRQPLTDDQIIKYCAVIKEAQGALSFISRRS
jgi:uncharacterized protein YqeY